MLLGYGEEECRQPEVMRWEGASCLQHFAGEVQMAQGVTWSPAVQGQAHLSSLGTSEPGP